MPIRPCPNCGEPSARLLDGASKDAYVNYYRCGPCGHVWTTPKNDSGKITNHITPLTKDTK